VAGIYLHIPFCKQACSYCDFHFSTSLRFKDQLLEAMKKELLLRKEELNQEPLKAIYFGGGTPSILTATEINSFCSLILEQYVCENDLEITLEANPDDLTPNYLNDLTTTPINRLSVGIQSFRDEDLKLMNRAHTSKQAQQSLALIVQQFDNYTLDLIYGIPGLSHEDWINNIKIALSYSPKHISAYALTVEHKTVLDHQIKKKLIKPVDEQQSQEQFFILKELLEKEGFEQYEISNFAKDSNYAVNNTAYWKQEPYLGIGPSAHSFDGINRSWNKANNWKYIRAIQEDCLPSEKEQLSLWESYNEFVMTGLRTMWGIAIKDLEDKFSEALVAYFIRECEPKLQNKILINEKGVIKLHPSQLFYADGIASDLFFVP